MGVKTTAMRISLLITTYERPDALSAVLRSVERQSLAPHEVIVGDDGSGPDTAEAVRSFADRGCPVRHEWLPHDGFRAGRMRNRAASRSTGDYLVMIDDDILLHRDFVADHAAAAESGWFVQGSRALLDADASARAIAGQMAWPGFFSGGVGNRKNLVHSPFLSRMFRGEAPGLRGIRTCNFGVWREDFVKVNGFDEGFVGWGREDSDFASRLLNSGVKRRNLRFAGLGCHLHHPPRSRDALAANDAKLSASVDSGLARCESGLNLHMDE